MENNVKHEGIVQSIEGLNVTVKMTVNSACSDLWGSRQSRQGGGGAECERRQPRHRRHRNRGNAPNTRHESCGNLLLSALHHSLRLFLSDV